MSHVMMKVSSFIRFEDDKGTVRYGEPAQSDLAGGLIGATVRVVEGAPFGELRLTKAHAKVAKVLSPIESTPIILCIGLNYKKHAEEASLDIAPYPVVFIKPADALAGPYDDVHVHPDTTPQLDYEGELVVVIGKDGKNISEEKALDYVLGYTIGNDVSARNFQLPNVSGGQFCYAKSFDGFAPMGPAILTPEAVPDPQALSYVTRVDGEQRQETSTDDMIWTVRQIIAHLSRGTTLRKGTLIMTGTPSGNNCRCLLSEKPKLTSHSPLGVGLFISNGFLRNGSIVEVELRGLGTIKNKIVFD
ncbi:Fumarylacetoacetate hydrolase domain-containing protein 2 [Penicillium rolfsii]|nr:Fumarylacetoacetate hydrolase domain-containing protein 2 [Penicillium rolfsii]